MQIPVIQLENVLSIATDMLSNVKTCDPMPKSVIQRKKNLLSYTKTCYLTQKRVIQCDKGVIKREKRFIQCNIALLNTKTCYPLQYNLAYVKTCNLTRETSYQQDIQAT